VLHAREYLYYAGDECRAVHLIRAGAFKSSRVTGDGEEHILDFPVPGDALGLDAMSGGRHTADAVALETSSVHVISCPALVEIWRSVPGIHLAAMRHLAEAMARNEEMLLTIGRRNADQRVAFFLHRFGERLQQRGLSAIEFHLPMTRADIACYLGIAAETASRAMTRLQEAGVITTTRNLVRIHDREALGSLAGGPVITALRERTSEHNSLH
jgi:CRP/FNR family transcriptional regulator